MSEPVRVYKKQLDSLNLLRGIAVIAVVLCHFGGAMARTNAWPIFQQMRALGDYGVHLFFVISGFVIPLSLSRGKYEMKDYFRFLYKRAIRLHPAFLLAWLFTLVIGTLSAHFKHEPIKWNMLDLLLSSVYLRPQADNPVFWTLLVEAEYYIFIGLFFALVKRFPILTVAVFIPLLMVVCPWIPSFTPNLRSLPQVIGFFLVGMLTYLIFEQKGNQVLNYLMLLAVGIAASVSHILGDLITVATGVMAILYYRRPIPAAWQYPGIVSYSIYLIHFPIGVKVINLLKHKSPGGWVDLLLLIFTSAVVFIVVKYFNRLIELPMERLSQKIKYTNARPVKAKEGNRLSYPLK